MDAGRDAWGDGYIVEQDDGDSDPFDSLEIGLENVRLWGLGGPHDRFICKKTAT